MVGFWARKTLALLGVRVQCTGAAPPPPCFVVSNHLGYLDVIVLQSVISSVFVAKSEVRDWPVIGPLTACFDTLYVDRDVARDSRRINAQIERLLDAGDGVVLFPEGTSSAGHTVLPFRSALLDHPARADIPVHALALAYRVPKPDPAAETSVCWWGGMTFADHFYRLLGLRVIEVFVRIDPHPVSCANRKELASALRASVNRQLQAIPRTVG